MKKFVYNIGLWFQPYLPPEQEGEDCQEESEGSADGSGDRAEMFLEVDEHDRIPFRTTRSKSPHRLATCCHILVKIKGLKHKPLIGLL